MRLYRVYVHRFLPMDYCSHIVSHIPVPRVLPAGNVCFLVFVADVCEDQSEKKGKIGLDQDENSQVS